MILMLAAGAFGKAAPAAAWWPDAVDEFVAFLNAMGREEFGVASARRPRDVVNRVDVVFDASTPAEMRTKNLQTIGRRFLRVVSDQTGISTVTVVERSASGLELDRAVVRIVGSSGGVPACQDSPAPS